MGKTRANVELFVSQAGKVPFEDWFHSIRDGELAARVLMAIEDLRRGEFKNCRSIGCGVFEKRVLLEPTTRLFFALVGNDGILVLNGSSNPSKKEGADTALAIWKEFKENAH
jgi:putative addiction module killer protein